MKSTDWTFDVQHALYKECIKNKCPQKEVHVTNYGWVWIDDSIEFSFTGHDGNVLNEEKFMKKMRKIELIEINKQDKLLSNFQTKYRTKKYSQKLLKY